MLNRFIPVLFVLCVLAVPLVPALELPPENLNWYVKDDLTLNREIRIIPGSVIVSDGATLRMEGSILKVGHSVVVEEGATLVMGPKDGLNSGIQPLNPEAGWFMSVNGTFTTAGEPRTVLEGFNGNGLDSVLLMPGGLKVAGTADLQDVILRNGTAGLAVDYGGHVRLERALVQNLYLMGMATLGTLELESVEARDNIISLTGKGPDCRITVRNSTIAGMAASLQLNTCDTLIEDSTLTGADNGAVVVGSLLEIRRSEVVEYRTKGIRLDSGSNLVLEDVVLRGSNRVQESWEPLQDQNGLNMKPDNQATLERVTVSNNDHDGVYIQQSAVQIHNSTFRDNDGYGVAAVKAYLPDNLADTNTFERNAKGPISSLATFQTGVYAANGTTLPGLHIEIVRDDTGEVAFGGWQNGTAPLTVYFETYDVDANGLPFLIEGFSYVAEHPQFGRDEGEVRLGAPNLNFNLGEKTAKDISWLRPVLIGAGLALLVAGLILGKKRAKAAGDSPTEGSGEPDSSADQPTGASADGGDTPRGPA